MNKLCDFILLFLAQLPRLTKVVQVLVRTVEPVCWFSKAKQLALHQGNWFQRGTTTLLF